MTELKVTSIRYFKTRRGLGYQAKTNVDGVEIWNDGMGGCTFLEGDNAHKYKHLDWDGEDKMDGLIDEYEKIQEAVKEQNKFIFTPRPPTVPKTWQGLLEASLKKNGVEGCRALEGFWENEVEMSNEEPKTKEQMIQSAIDNLICNLHDMTKEDAISQLVDLYAEEVL